MSGKQYRTGIVITGDAKGGVKAVQLTNDELAKLNKTTGKNTKAQKKNRKETKDSSESMKDYAGKLGLVTGAASALTAVLGGMSIASTVQETIALTRETNAWAAAVGVTNQELAASEYAAQSLGLSQGKIADIYKDTAEKISDAYINGGGEAVEALKNINITAADLNSLSPDQQLLAIADGLDSVGAHNNKIQILESLASDASLLIPLLENSGEKFKQLKQEAIESNYAMSNIDAAKITLLDVEFRKLSASSDGFGNGLTAGLTPAIYGVTKELSALTLGWGSTSEMTAQALDITVTGLGFVLDVGHEVLTTVKLIELGWLHIGDAGLTAFIGLGQVGVDFVNNFLFPFREGLAAIIEGWGYLIQAAGDLSGNTAWQEAGDFMLGYGKSIKDTRFELEDFVDLQKDLQVEIAKANDELVTMLNAEAPSSEIKDWLAAQRIEVENLAAANVAAAEKRKELSDQSAADLKSTTEASAQLYKDTASSIRSSFSGAFRDILDDQNTFVDRMKNTIKDMLADIATTQLSKPLIIPFAAGISGATGANAADKEAIAKQLGGTKADTEGVMADVGEYIGVGMIGYMAGGAAAKMFDVANPGMTQNLSAVGAMIGQYAGNPIAGAVIGAVAGAMFKGDWVTRSSGFDLSYNSAAGVSGFSYQDQKREGGLFSSSSYRTTTKDIDAELSQRLGLMFDSFEDSLLRQVNLLNIGNANGLVDFASSAKLNTTGLDKDEIQNVINGWVGDVSVEMATALLPGLDAFRRVGEEGAETIDRLTESLSQMYSLGRNLDITIAGLTASGNAAAQYGIQIQYATADILDTASQLANASDMQTRLALEDQLFNQVMARYELEQTMLNSLQQSVTSISGSISDMRAAIASDIINITGASSVRSAAEIGADLSGISLAAAPDASGYLNAQDKFNGANENSSALLLDILKSQGVAGSLKNQIGDLSLNTADLTKERAGLVRNSSYYQNEIDIDEGEHPGLISGYEDIIARNNERIAEIDQQDNHLTELQDSLTVLNNDIALQVSDYESLLDTVADLQVDADAALTDYNASMTDYLSLTSDQVDQLQNLRDETLSYYDAMLQLDNAMGGMAATIGDTLAALQLDSLNPINKLGSLETQFTALSASAADATGYDLVSIADQMNALVNPLLAEASSLYASGQGYQDIYNLVTGSLGDVQQLLIDGAPQDYEASSIDLLTNIDGLLGGMQDVLSAAELAIVDAIDTSRVATVSTLEDIRGLLSGEGDNLSFDNSVVTATAAKGSNETVTALKKIETLLAEGKGDIQIKVVTPDGEVIKEETITEVQARYEHGEILVPAS